MSKKAGLQDLDMTPDEVQSFSEAFKNEEFRKLFFEYAQELNDPENRKKYEEEIIALESERGVECEFLKPEPGFAYKTSVNGNDKCFINVAQCAKIGQPKSSMEQRDGARGLRWQVPHSCTPPREDMDKSGKRCTVYDVLFHPDTLRMAETNERFAQMVRDITCDEVEKFFKVKLDRANLKKLKRVKYFGRPSDTVIRKSKGSATQLPPDDILASMPYPYKSDQTPVFTDDRVSAQSSESSSSKNGNHKTGKHVVNGEKVGDDFTTPHYTVKYRYETDLQDFATLLGSSSLVNDANRPNAIEVRIDLPLLTAANQIDVDVLERSLELQSEKPAKYKLHLRFSYEVLADDANARFDKKTRSLTISVPVRKQLGKPLIEELVTVVSSQESDDSSSSAQPPASDDLTPTLTPTALSDPSADLTPTHSECSSPAHCTHGHLHSILKCHDSPTPSSHSHSHSHSHSADEACYLNRRRVSKSVSFNETLQIETPDYQKPVALAFETTKPCKAKGTDSSGNSESESTDCDDLKKQQLCEPTLTETPTNQNEQFAVETMLSWQDSAPEKTQIVQVSQDQEVPVESKKKRNKRNKRKKNASGDHALPKTPNLRFENQIVDELDR